MSSSKETPVFVDGELIGWDVEYPDEWKTEEYVGGVSTVIKTQAASRLFIPVSSVSEQDARDARWSRFLQKRCIDIE